MSIMSKFFDKDNVSNDSVASIFGIDEAPKELIRQEHALDLYGADIEIYHDMLDQSEVMQESVAEGEAELKTFPTLAEDIFGSLFKYTPKLKEKDEMLGAYKLNHKIMSDLVESEEYQKLRKSTRLDIFNSSLASSVMQEEAKEIIRVIKEQQGPGKDMIDLINDMLQKQQKLQGIGDQLGPGTPGDGDMPGGAGGGLTPEQAQELAEQQQQLKQELQQQEQQLEEDMNNGGAQQIQQAMQQAMNQAQNDIDEMRDFVTTWGFDKGDPRNRISLEESKAALERIRRSTKLKKFEKLIGRFRELAMEDQKKKIKDGATSIKSVKTGNRIESVLPSEKAKLAGGEAAKRDFMRRFHQKELLVYELENTQKKGKGPIIVCVDGSGSMSGTNEEWAKATALALLEVANKQKRDFACVIFESYVDDSWVHIIPKGELKPETVIDIAECFPCGGTDFEAPLERALDILKMSKFKKADIVFITDGDCGISQEFLKKFNKVKEDKEFAVKSVLINTGSYGASDSTLKLFSDDVITIKQLADMEDTSHQLFQSI